MVTSSYSVLILRKTVAHFIAGNILLGVGYMFWPLTGGERQIKGRHFQAAQPRSIHVRVRRCGDNDRRCFERYDALAVYLIGRLNASYSQYALWQKPKKKTNLILKGKSWCPSPEHRDASCSLKHMTTILHNNAYRTPVRVSLLMGNCCMSLLNI